MGNPSQYLDVNRDGRAPPQYRSVHRVFILANSIDRNGVFVAPQLCLEVAH
jgi:hypothetical protein